MGKFMLGGVIAVDIVEPRIAEPFGVAMARNRSLVNQPESLSTLPRRQLENRQTDGNR